LSAAVPLSPPRALSLTLCPMGPTCRRQFPSPARSLSLCLVGPVRQLPSRCPARPLFSLCAVGLPCQFRLPRSRRISRPRRPPTRPAPFLEPRQCPAHAPCLISHSFTLSRALPTPPAAAGDPRPRFRPPSSPETAPSLPELRPEVRHPSPCPISPIAPCARPISPSPVLVRGGPPCSLGGRPIELGLVPRR
jgi:hypothetical protein